VSSKDQVATSHKVVSRNDLDSREEQTMNAHRIEGAVAIVTGANRGIGRALTEALLARGAQKVYATARNPEALRALRDERLVPLRLDVTDPDQIRAAAEAASDVELLFNNAGVVLGRGIAESSVLDQARREMEVNYFGPLQLVYRLAPTLARNGGGAVVNIGSAAGLTNVPFFPTYSASKAALHSLTQAARVLLGPQGTSVFGVYAGPVDTDMVRDLALPKTSPNEVAIAILNGIEAGHEDIFPDSFAVDFGRQFESSPKASERQIAAMVAAMLSGSAA
jgi:NAD(P)-dependent dehydrogenase (short-subunit alcohol dehydrogenase family)